MSIYKTLINILAIVGLPIGYAGLVFIIYDIFIYRVYNAVVFSIGNSLLENDLHLLEHGKYWPVENLNQERTQLGTAPIQQSFPYHYVKFSSQYKKLLL